MSKVSVGVTPTLVSSNGRRSGLVMRNLSLSAIYLGSSEDVSTDTGFPILEYEILVDEDGYDARKGLTGNWYAVVASGTADLRVIEYED